MAFAYCIAFYSKKSTYILMAERRAIQWCDHIDDDGDGINCFLCLWFWWFINERKSISEKINLKNLRKQNQNSIMKWNIIYFVESRIYKPEVKWNRYWVQFNWILVNWRKLMKFCFQIHSGVQKEIDWIQCDIILLVFNNRHENRHNHFEAFQGLIENKMG